jgi:hypothetical protein
MAHCTSDITQFLLYQQASLEITKNPPSMSHEIIPTGNLLKNITFSKDEKKDDLFMKYAQDLDTYII